jgi:hypothetical protein
VSLELKGINGLSAVGEYHGAVVLARGEALVLDGHSVEGNQIIGHHLTLSSGGAIELLIRQQGQVVPVAVLVGVGSGHVLGGAQTNVHGLNGPLKLGQQDVVGRLKDASALEAVNANQAEPNALDVNIMTSESFNVLLSYQSLPSISSRSH